ncbi:leucine-rich repeat and transmembrane domain-containing protein 2-like [Ostrinia nubilalis]|uniref:leucine-rich repeat and transmembrane domain-containing protein 2-like n=1 Tax=Ostrinia nubilalis TaxID=29057 RepID=UPI00308241D0
MEAAARALPAGFVAACPRLEDLELQMMQADAIPEGFLLNATALKKFKAAFWPLKELPVDLFDYSPNLEEIDLSSNGLESLPSGLFSRLAGSLRVLSLARNRLHAAAALQVAPLAGLRRLYLADNPLGDLCPAASASILARSASYLAPLRALEELVLSRAGLARVCADWTHHMPALRRLDLSHNRIAELQVQ